LCYYEGGENYHFKHKDTPISNKVYLKYMMIRKGLTFCKILINTFVPTVTEVPTAFKRQKLQKVKGGCTVKFGVYYMFT